MTELAIKHFGDTFTVNDVVEIVDILGQKIVGRIFSIDLDSLDIDSSEQYHADSKNIPFKHIKTIKRLEV